MSAKYEELIAAGAPRLPEGYYYKISTFSDEEGDKLLRVRIMRERTGWLDKRMAVSAMYYRDIEGVAGVASLCYNAWRKMVSKQLPDGLAPFVGRHP